MFQFWTYAPLMAFLRQTWIINPALRQFERKGGIAKWARNWILEEVAEDFFRRTRTEMRFRHVELATIELSAASIPVRPCRFSTHFEVARRQTPLLSPPFEA